MSTLRVDRPEHTRNQYGGKLHKGDEAQYACETAKW
jgi:hypothetical protein